MDGMQPTSVEAVDVEPTAAVYGLFGDRRFLEQADRLRGVWALGDLESADVAEFLFRLGLERMGRKRKVFSSEDSGELAWQAHVVLRRGVEALDPWPDTFHRTLDDMRQRWNAVSHRSLNACAGAVERWQSRLPAGSGLRILAAVADYKLAAAGWRMDGVLSQASPLRRRR